MNFNSYFTIKHTSNLRILLLTLFFIVPAESTSECNITKYF